MALIQRQEILDFITYGEQREALRERILPLKASRRIHLGENLTFLFENRETVRYQIQEMLKIERIVKEADIQHEIATYNELLGGPGELGCTLLIEIDNPAERNVKLKEWLGLPQHLYLKLASGARVPARFDARQVGKDRLSSVQYLKFDTAGQTPLAIGVDHPRLHLEADLSSEQQFALEADLRESLL